MRVLVVGASGYFGRLLVDELVALDGVEVVAAGRRESTLRSLAGEHGDGRVSTRAVDLAAPPVELAAAIDDVDLVICAAGPFQGLPLTLLEECLARDVAYIDLCDDRTFAREAIALATGSSDPPLVAIGWSAVPAMTGALASMVVEGWEVVDRLDLSIAPGNRMPRAHGTVASLLDSLGKPFEVMRDGAWHPVTGWSDPRVFSYPAPIGPRRGWLVDVPAHDDRQWPECAGVGTIEFRVGAELRFLNWGTSFLAWCARRRLVSNWVRWTPLLRRAMAAFGWLGTDHGAVGLSARGRDACGRSAMVTAAVVAEAEATRIPVMPAAELVRRILVGRETRRGALSPYDWISGDDLRAACDGRGYRLVVQKEDAETS